MNRKIIVSMIVALICFASTAVIAQDDLENQRSCAQCGMDRKAYGYSRMVIHYEDGASSAVCSLHCAVKELSLNPARSWRTMQVADRNTRSLIDATQANWIIGGSKRGVMTQMPKWAFQNKESAAAFITEYGGKFASWEEVFRTAQEELRNRAH